MAATEKNSGQSQKKWLNTYARFSGIAIQMAVVILAGAWLGNKADDRWETSPWFTTLGALFSFAIAIYLLFAAIPKK
jgi:F0F1-type ATP synthase assembly protein I